MGTGQPGRSQPISACGSRRNSQWRREGGGSSVAMGTGPGGRHGNGTGAGMAGKCKNKGNKGKKGHLVWGGSDSGVLGTAETPLGTLGRIQDGAGAFGDSDLPCQDPVTPSGPSLTLQGPHYPPPHSGVPVVPMSVPRLDRPLLVALGTLWGHFCGGWGQFGGSWGHGGVGDTFRGLGSFLGHVGTPWGHLEGIGRVWGHQGSSLGTSGLLVVALGTLGAVAEL